MHSFVEHQRGKHGGHTHLSFKLEQPEQRMAVHEFLMVGVGEETVGEEVGESGPVEDGGVEVGERVG